MTDRVLLGVFAVGLMALLAGWMSSFASGVIVLGAVLARLVLELHRKASHD